MVLNGMSPHGTLLVALARHSFGGTDCRKCSMAGNNSTGSNTCFSRSCGMFLANFQIHFSTSSATLKSCESADAPLVGNGLTIWSNKLNKALRYHRISQFICGSFRIYSPEHRHSAGSSEKAEYNHIDKTG